MGEGEQDSNGQLTEADIRSLQLELQIGEGSYGKVFKAKLPSTSAYYAVKMVEIDVDGQAEHHDDERQRLKETEAYKTMEREISMMQTCASCPQIVRVCGIGVAFGEDNKAKVMVAMELCDHGSVSDILRRLKCGLKEPEIQVITHEVLLGLKYLHDEKKIHRDVKAGNILLTRDFQPKLADFGISCELQNTCARRETQIGSPYWMAPEVIKAGFGYNSKADIWSMGITIVEMAEMQPPYFHIPPARAMFVITTKPPKGIIESGIAAQFSQELVDFVSACLTVDPNARPRAEALLSKPFVSGQKHESARAVLAKDLGPRLAEAQPRDAGRPVRSQQKSNSGTLTALPPVHNTVSPVVSQVLPLEAVKSLVSSTSVDTSDDAPQRRSWVTQAAPTPSPPAATTQMTTPKSAPPPPPAAAAISSAVAGAAADDSDEELSPEEIKRRAREWVNKMVPLEDDSDSEPRATSKRTPSTSKRAPSTEKLSGEAVLLPKGKLGSPQKGSSGFDVWDSDDEGVSTRTRVEAQPEAGAGGPSNNSVPFFMQVLEKQWGK